MQSQSYAFQLRSLVAMEQRNRQDYTERMNVVYNLRLQTIDQSEASPEQKERMREQAAMQYRNFTNRAAPEATEFPF